MRDRGVESGFDEEYEMCRIWVWMLGILLALASCDLAKDTSATSQGGAQGAAGIADKMSAGTAGDADPETGDTGDGTAQADGG
jgi:hypothetical protein